MAKRAMAQRAMAQRAMAGAPAGGMLQPGMKKGGDVAKLEKELKHHEGMKASKAHTQYAYTCENMKKMIEQSLAL
jgi:hypothetical protein